MLTCHATAATRRFVGYDVSTVHRSHRCPRMSTDRLELPRPTSTNQVARPFTSHSEARTAQSIRPPTARPLTTASSRHESSFVVAVIECRGIGREVGIAALDRDTGQVDLIQVIIFFLDNYHIGGTQFVTFTQLTDCQTYVKTLHHLHLHYPSVVIVPDTFFSSTETSVNSSTGRTTSTSLLVQCIQGEFPYVPIEPVLRKYWNEESGKQSCGGIATLKIKVTLAHRSAIYQPVSRRQ